MSFHDDKLWQEVFTATLDLLDATDGSQSDLAVEVRRMGLALLTETTKAVVRKRRPNADHAIAVRSVLSVLWARDVLSDDAFGKLDAAFEVLANKLPR